MREGLRHARGLLGTWGFLGKPLLTMFLGSVAWIGEKHPSSIENAIVDKVIKAGKSGFPITKSQFLLKVGTVVNRLGLETQFKMGCQGRITYMD